MNIRPIISGLAGAAIGLGLLWAAYAIFFSTDETVVPTQQTVATPSRHENEENVIELAPVTQSASAPVTLPASLPATPAASGPASAAVFETPLTPDEKAKLCKTSVDALLAGDKASSAHDMELAIAFFRRAVQLDPANVTALEALATALLADDKVEQTVEVYQKILKLNPGDKTATFNLAMAYVRLKRYEQAEDIFNEILEAQPYDIKARTNLATLLQIQERFNEAREQWTKITALEPNRVEAWERIGEVSVDMGEPAAAMDAYAQAAKIAPKDPMVWKNFAITARQAGSGGRAIFAYKKAIELEPKNAQLHKDFGDVLLEVYRVKKDRDLIVQAVTEWRESLKLDPKQDDVKKQLEIYSSTAATSMPAKQ